MKRIIYIIILLFAIIPTAVVEAQTPTRYECEGGDCGDPNNDDPDHIPLDSTEIFGGISLDPNELIGPAGIDSVRWVSANSILNYFIFFENDSELATANAQIIDVRFDMPYASLFKDFGLGNYYFANQSFSIPDYPSAYSTRLDLRDSMYIYVDLLAGINVEQNQAYWHFTSIDPETGYAPWQASRGLLPVNDSTHVGEGFVSFRLKPEELHTGDTISLVANILFDQNDTIATNRWCNRIDAGAPTSKVKGKKDNTNELLYHLSFEANDDRNGCGVKNVRLFQADHFGNYEEIGAYPADTIIDLEIEGGKTYLFYSLAEDRVGNLEPLKDRADLEINVNVPPTDIFLSDSTFRDDIEHDGFIGQFNSVDTEGEVHFTYELSNGKGSMHNDLFKIDGDRLLANQSFKCANNSIYHIRVKTTDEGGKSFDKPFNLHMQYVLERPKPDTLTIDLCVGESYEYRGHVYDKAGTFYDRKENEFMCDSVTVLIIRILPTLDAPTVTVEGICTLVSSAAIGNQWYYDNGAPVEGATDQKFTPTEEGIYYVCAGNGNCMSPPSLRYQVKLTDNLDLTWNLAEGWNWVSSNLMSSEMQQTATFLSPIAKSIETFTDGNLMLTQGNNGLDGNLTSIDPRVGYWLQANKNVNNTWSGQACKPENTIMAVHHGWNNIGYIPIGEHPLEAALINHRPAENDLIKTQTEFAVFSDGKWHGTLEYMRPGEAYMYLAGRDASFAYPVTRVFELEPMSSKQMKKANALSAPWNVNEHKYRDNMTVVGVLVSKSGYGTEPGVFTVGAFVGDECRGFGDWVDDRIFLVIHGDEGINDKITFKAINNATGEVFDITQTMNFSNDAIGTKPKPYYFRLDTDSGVEDVLAGNGEYSIYPNPVRDRLYVNGDVQNVSRVKVIDINGKLIIDEAYHDGIDVTRLEIGTYIACIVTTQGIVYKKFIKAL